MASIGIRNGHNEYCRLRDVCFLHFELMVSGSQINLGEDLSLLKLIEEIINSWQWVLVLDGHPI